MAFPLYENISKNISEKDLLVKQKVELINKIKELDLYKRELLYALIKAHFIYTDNTEEGLPYSSKKTEDGIEFDLEIFPARLKQILYKFIQMNDQV